MSVAKRIVRFTFWMNLVTFSLLGLEMGSFLYHLPRLVSLLLAVGLAGVISFQTWFLKRRYGVTKIETFYSTGDERDREIAFRVHNNCIYFLTQGLIFLMVVVFLLLLAGMTSALKLGTWTLGIAFVVLLCSNCQYYYLWQKYDRV
ncbi:hypothetical protein [Lactiplantibacillus carotarum]|uniref:hypothetical protein n=1 Tax=Lactiplantibacillus carotarum TaxID=2993456 RepID=UPI00298EDA58|nr:hypothetical protein [Lactiplantibacillus carotarum]